MDISRKASHHLSKRKTYKSMYFDRLKVFLDKTQVARGERGRPCPIYYIAYMIKMGGFLHLPLSVVVVDYYTACACSILGKSANVIYVKSR